MCMRLLVQKILVEEGPAHVVYTNYTKRDYLSELNEAQEQSKQKKIGLTM
ncbi:thermonuclease family protein [Enterococcus faecalis]